ncbi:MAG: serine/threonine-protein kinase, partial [Tepidiformaceae bacterium]
MPTLLDRVRAALAPDFIVERELGSGGMGSVFLARDQRLARDVAVKVLRPEFATALAVERFAREPRVLARLNHPNIVPVHRAGESDGLHWFVMELSTGETLSSRLERGAIEPQQAAAIARDLLAGLGGAHAGGVIHRDVKPSNVFLEGRGARLGDFGIAHDELVESLTRTGSHIGTAPWMAPEQRAGEPATTRTDLWAAGAVLYEMFTGRRWTATPGDWRGVPAWVVPTLR